MGNVGVTAVLVVALVLPVALFWWMKSRTRLHGLATGAIAVGVGWALNIAWAMAGQGAMPGDAAPMEGDPVSIATALGWACPTLLVLLAWLAWHLKHRRTRAA